MRAVEAIRQANQPRDPEGSIRLRVACTGSVLVAIAACASLHEVSGPSAWAAMALVAFGMVFSYLTRARPPGWIKVLVAIAAIAATVWFFDRVSAGPISDITSVELPLTVLFVCILVLHSFHVPSRRDLMFSLGASGGLMAVGAAQAITLHFGGYALAWAAFSLWTLVELWASASGGGHLSVAGVGTSLAGVTVVAVFIFLVLPAPTVSVRLNFVAKAGNGGLVADPGALAGDGGSPTEPARAGSPTGPTRIGGYLGFANSLDTAARGKLSHTVVMLVRAQRPSYWVGETFDTWDGQDWTSTGAAAGSVSVRSPFVLPMEDGASFGGTSDLQTFYVMTSTADLVFHAESASQIWFPAAAVSYFGDGSIVSPIGLGRGAVYTVDSKVDSPSPDELRSGTRGLSLPLASPKLYTQLPHSYPEVAALAKSITAGVPTTYDKVQALIAWIGANTRYSTDIPPLPAGADTVDEFLFGDRVGFCEQISTSLAVMLRTLGIPARETVGYVPGPYNPITDVYQVEADDAHAWVEVWFPGYGWQSFDPTAVVPLANPSPGATALSDLGHAFGHIPVLPVSVVAALAALVVSVVRWRRRRPATWAERVARSVERAGRRAGRARRPDESLVEYAGVLHDLLPDGPTQWRGLASDVEASVYGGREPPPEVRRQLVASARRGRIEPSSRSR